MALQVCDKSCISGLLQFGHVFALSVSVRSQTHSRLTNLQFSEEKS
jgi:hypothetical protein